MRLPQRLALIASLLLIVSSISARADGAVVYDLSVYSRHYAAQIFALEDSERTDHQGPPYYDGWAMVVTRNTGGVGPLLVRICEFPSSLQCTDYSKELTGAEFQSTPHGDRAFIRVTQTVVPGLGEVVLDMWREDNQLIRSLGCKHPLVLGGYEVTGERLGNAYVVRGGQLGKWRVAGSYCGALGVTTTSVMVGA